MENKNNFSTSWKRSKKPKKQRKYLAQAPLHIKQKFVHSHLSKELKKKFGKRSVQLRKGDSVRIVRGGFRKHEGKVERIDLKKTRVMVSGAEITKRDGSKKMVALHPSNMIIMSLNMDDRVRQKIIERK